MLLADLVGLDVELEMNPRIEGAVGILRLVLEVDLGKRQTHVLRSRPAAAVAERDAGDDDVVHLDDEVLLLAFARLAVRDGGFLQVRARRARLQQIRRRLVDVVEEGKIGEGRLAGATATAAPMFAGFVTPQENDSTSISSLCLDSWDSPLMSPIFAKMSDAIWIHLVIRRKAG